MSGIHVWTVEEIRSLAEFGNEHGWFYGIVRDGGRLMLAEIIPGFGYCSPWPLWSPREWWYVARDLAFVPAPPA